VKRDYLRSIFPDRRGPQLPPGDLPPVRAARPPARSAILVVVILAVLWGNYAVAGEKPVIPAARLQGTFLQLTAAHGDWQPADWARLFEYFKELRLSQLVIQWTVYDDLAFFPTTAGRQVPRPSLSTIMQLADAAGLQIWVGLSHDPEFWDKIRRDPKLVEVYFRRVRLRDEAIARELAPQLQPHPSFRGWYITEEVDDVNWQEAPAREVLFAFLRDLSAFLHTLTPGATVALSGFTNARVDPETLGRFWKELLGSAPIDRVLFQDGIGAEKLKLDELPLYLGALAQASKARSRQLQVVVELFRQASAKPFRAQPASWERVARQLKIAACYAPDGIMAFSVPEYMTPLGGQEADNLFRAYRHYEKSW
jgi:hypothetical protein